MGKKIEKKNAVKEVKKDSKTIPETKIESKLETSKGPERPKCPAEFCLDKKDWDSNTTCFYPGSKSCKTCKKDYPKTHETCSERADYLVAVGKITKTKKTGTGEHKTKNGVATQTNIINAMLSEKKPLTDIIAAVAKIHYSDNEAGRSVSSGRVNRHIKSIKDGSCKNAETLKPIIAYLDKKPKAEVAPAKK
jgi:hypothetical protein